MSDKVVLCTDGNEVVLATRRVFDTSQALDFAKTIHPSRNPVVVSTDEFIAMLPPAMTVYSLKPEPKDQRSSNDWLDKEWSHRRQESRRESIAAHAQAREIFGERFDNECICDCPDNQDEHVIAQCPNRKPLEICPRGHRHFCLNCAAVVAEGDFDCEIDTDHSFGLCSVCSTRRCACCGQQWSWDAACPQPDDDEPACIDCNTGNCPKGEDCKWFHG